MEEINDIYKRRWIIGHSEKILEGYTEGITVRQLYYRLVAVYQMKHDVRQYKRVVSAMTQARWENIVDMEAFIDRERSMYGKTEDDTKDLDEEIENGKEQVKAWMNAYHLNRWSNQENYVEVWIEKKALQGVFERPCLMASVGLAPCKGYPSITFLHEATKRFKDALIYDKKLIMLYYGDYDPSGADIPRSIEENLRRMGVDIEVRRMALNKEQIDEMNLPGIPPKITDSRTRNWEGGDIVELDAIEPKILTRMCKEAIEEQFDRNLYDELKEDERTERDGYRQALKEFVKDLKEEE